jgi:peptide chain release factor 1
VHISLQTITKGRVTDHRINLTINNLDQVLEGTGLSVFMAALKKNHETALMEELLDE